MDDYFEHARREMYPQLRDSAVYLGVLSDRSDPDPKFCLELGAALMYDKPLIFVLDRTARIPMRLRQLADAVIDGCDLSTPAGVEAMYRRLEPFLEAAGGR